VPIELLQSIFVFVQPLNSVSGPEHEKDSKNAEERLCDKEQDHKPACCISLPSLILIEDCLVKLQRYACLQDSLQEEDYHEIVQVNLLKVLCLPSNYICVFFILANEKVKGPNYDSQDNACQANEQIVHGKAQGDL